MAQTPFKDSLHSFVCQGISELYSDGELYDVKVTVGDQEFSCHRMLLASTCKFFRAQFRNEPTSDHVKLDRDYVSPESFALLLRMLYEEVDVIQNADDATDLLISAVFLQAQFIQEHCENFLVKNMKPYVCPDMWQFADSYELKLLGEGAKKMATTKFEEVARRSSFTRLPLSFLLTVLSSEDLVVTKEDKLCDAVLKWVRANVERRQQYLPELLPFINFTRFTDDYYHTLRETALKFTCLQGYLNEGLIYKLETSKKLNSVIKTEILARQDKRVPESSVQSVLVTVEIPCTEDESGFPAMKAVVLDSGELTAETKPLPSLPCSMRRHFATCVLRNELYLSGRGKYAHSDNFFVYNAGSNAWKTLESLPEPRQKHAMVAVSSDIFVLAGHAIFVRESDCFDEEEGTEEESEEGTEEESKERKEEAEEGAEEKTVMRSEIIAYSTVTKTWRVFAHLTEPRSDVTAAGLGHRIYVFGGKNADDQPTSLVECVDTLTGSLYRVGCLSSPCTSGARALGNGGAIFLITEENVYRMRESLSSVGTQEKPETSSEFSSIKAGAQKRMTAIFKQAKGQDAREQNKNAENQHLTQPNPQSRENDGPLSAALSETNLDAENTTACYQDSACASPLEVLVLGGLGEDETRLSDAIGVDIDTGGLTHKMHPMAVLSRCEMHVLNMPKLKEGTCIFRDSKNLGSGYPRMISLTDLKDPANGYVSEEGEVTVQVEITITAPPELEGEDAEEE
ncbi:hypothetical protein BaRGS_00020816 [Batillaria attramentaria]|uniref:BTB domain-containing protein n=1 Tax=Batillaria attramentaria TaxID=370345 RepID=A0ABD0KM39_9CAEN